MREQDGEITVSLEMAFSLVFEQSEVFELIGELREYPANHKNLEDREGSRST